MSKAACKIIICLGALAEQIGDTMQKTNEGPADRIIRRLEKLTERVKRMGEDQG